ncbi:hypothetical protein ACFCYB_18195 [Streptomyces sp. NPDC056309]|uniref:hypothetical protein n=1 Tax=unclassified Streptomyces TaxID=2593676 RepID=UPI0035E01FD3
MVLGGDRLVQVQGAVGGGLFEESRLAHGPAGYGSILGFRLGGDREAAARVGEQTVPALLGEAQNTAQGLDRGGRLRGRLPGPGQTQYFVDGVVQVAGALQRLLQGRAWIRVGIAGCAAGGRRSR